MLMNSDTDHDGAPACFMGHNPFCFARSSCPKTDENSKYIIIFLVQLPVCRLCIHHRTVGRAPKISILPRFFLFIFPHSLPHRRCSGSGAFLMQIPLLTVIFSYKSILVTVQDYVPKFI